MGLEINQDRQIKPIELHYSEAVQTPDLEGEVQADSWKGKLGELILKIAYIVTTPLRIIAHTLRRLFYVKSERAISEYAFTQQYNDSCHLTSIFNLHMVEAIRKNSYNLQNLDFKTRRQWLGENQKFLVKWTHLIGEICQPDAATKFPELYEYIMGALKSAPILPHFYNENKTTPFTGLGAVLEFGELPFFFIDVNALEKVKFRLCMKTISFDDMLSLDWLGLKTSIVKDKGVYKIYDIKSKAFESIESLNWIEKEEKKVANGKTEVHFHINSDLLPSNAHANYHLPPSEYPIIMRDIEGLGFEQMGVVHELGGGFKFANENGEIRTYIPYHTSLLKLLFFVCGIGRDNEMIQKNDPLYPVVEQLRSLMAKDPENLWHPNNINAEMLMQYQIAKLFKNDPELFNEAKQVVDPLIKGYKNFDLLLSGRFFNQHGTSLKGDKMESYLLGREQTVAYFFMQNIRTAWYSSINPKIAIQAIEMGLPSKVGPAVHYYIKRQLSRGVSFRSLNGMEKKKSFLNVWDQIRKGLQGQTDRTDFMCFDDHGWVVSLDPKMIEIQNASKNIYDRKLLNRLGITGVDSMWGSELGLWYQRIKPMNSPAASMPAHSQKI